VEQSAAPFQGYASTPKGPVTLLVVDDEEPIRSALKRFLGQQNYEVMTAATGDEALESLERHKVSCVLLDVRLPDANGVDLVPKVLEREPNAAVLMLTAVNDAASAALCMQRGAMDYLTKPVDLTDLLRAIQRALRRRDTMIESQQINHWLKEEVAIRTAELRMERANLERISVATLEALVTALEAKDP
jgi:DNA-binding NtrC family response regulator